MTMLTSSCKKHLERLKLQREEFDRRYDVKKTKITAGDDLAPGRSEDG